MWEKVLWILAVWTLVGLIAAIAFGRSKQPDQDDDGKNEA